jgi:hypothetical protein
MSSTLELIRGQDSNDPVPYDKPSKPQTGKYAACRRRKLSSSLWEQGQAFCGRWVALTDMDVQWTGDLSRRVVILNGGFLLYTTSHLSSAATGRTRWPTRPPLLDAALRRRLPPACTSSRLPRASSPYVSRGLSTPPTAGSRAWRLAGDAEPSCRGRSSCGNCQPGLLVCGGRVGVGGGAHTGEVWRLDLGSFGWSVFPTPRPDALLMRAAR